MSGEPICERCGHTISEHVIYREGIPPEAEGRVTAALFPEIETSGFYCPHLDMVKGEDYER